MPGTKSMTITLVDENGTEKSKAIHEGDKVSKLVPAGRLAILNGQQINRDAELRANDRLQVVRQSAKAAA